ncbi:MAG TPA: hypothetical protein VH164_10205 [Ktedonobacteraceae bacterium]|nr:hypothetical protein [Ktedonobacteraceae bacterium]
MPKIRITMEVDEEIADPNHEMGITEQGYLQISDALTDFGQDIDIQKVVD